MSCPDYGLGQLIDLTRCLIEDSLLLAVAGLPAGYCQRCAIAASAPDLGEPGTGGEDHSAQLIRANLPPYSY